MLDSPEVHVVSGTPWLMTWRGLAVMAALGTIAAALAAADLAFLAASLFAAGAIGFLYGHASFWAIGYTRRLSSTRAFQGDSVTLSSALANPRPLPVPWLEVWEALPAALTPPATEPVERSFADPRRVWLRQGLAAWPYRRVRWTRTLTCTARGVFTLGAVRLRTGDPLGLVEREKIDAAPDSELVVYPPVVPLRSLGLAMRDASLDVVTRTSLIVDPTRTAAVRDYRPGDPRRTIHWPASAHHGSLQVRVPEPATSVRVTLALDVHGFFFSGPEGSELLETTLSALASLAVFLHGRGAPVGLLTNSDPPTAIAPGSDVERVQAILEALARIRPRARIDLLPWALRHLPARSSIILATHAGNPSGNAITRAGLRQAGFAVHALTAAERDRRAEHDETVLVAGCDLSARLEGRA